MSMQRLFLVAFAVMLFVVGLGGALDPDLGWHLRTGETVLQSGVPRHDVFSHTVSDHRWITHEWLADVMMWRLYELGGWGALIVTFAGVAALTLALVYAASPGKPYLAALVTIVGMRATTTGPRPQLLTYLLTAVLVWLVEAVRRDRLDRRWLLLAPALVALWANLHSGYLLGVVLLGTYAVGMAIEQRIGEARPGSTPTAGLPRWLGGVAVASFLAAVINPNGTALWWYPFETLGSEWMQANILEWQSPDFHVQVFWVYGLLMLLGVLGMIFSPRRPTATDLLLFFGTAAAGLHAMRHIPIFVVVTVPITTRHWVQVLERTRWRRWVHGEVLRGSPPPLLAGLHLALAAAMVWFAVDRAQTVIARDSQLRPQAYPVEAVSYLEERGLTEQQVFNNYAWGGYLVWRGVPVFVDGRADVYRDAFLTRYQDTVDLRTDWRDLFADYDVGVVLIPDDHALGQVLSLAPGWQESYRDDIAVVYVRDDLALDERPASEHGSADAADPADG